MLNKSNINKSLCRFYVLVLVYVSVFLSIVVRSESSRNAFGGTSFL